MTSGPSQHESQPYSEKQFRKDEAQLVRDQQLGRERREAENAAQLSKATERARVKGKIR
jgi:hypothetical protein